MTALTTNIQKGGALLDDARRVVEAWDLELSPEANIARIADENLLGKASRSRSDDVLLRILRPRLVAPGPHVIETLKELISYPRAFTEAYYFETTRDEKLLADYAEGPLYGWYRSGRLAVDVDMTVDWLTTLVASRRIPDWSSSIRTRVARGLLAALRDYGVLRGKSRKWIESPHLSLVGFAYVAYRLYQGGASSRSLIATNVWRRWLLDPQRVEELFSTADRHGLLRFSSAGSAVRIDWLVNSLPEATHAAA